MKLSYTEKMIGLDYTKQKLAERLNVDPETRITLPQIFLDGMNIGGYSELMNHLPVLNNMMEKTDVHTHS